MSTKPIPSPNISISSNMTSTTMNNYDDNDEESFVVLGRSPTSFIFTEDGAETLQDALKSIDSSLNSIRKDRMDASKEFVEEEKEIQTLQEKVSALKVMEEKPTAEHLSFSTLSSELLPEEIQAKVDGMVEENKKLKEVIEQNNAKMQKQYEAMIKFQDDVQKVHDSHKVKFQEAKSYIAMLQTEKAQHLKDLEESRKKVEELEDKLKKHSIVAKSSLENITEFELQLARNKITDLETAQQKYKEQEAKLIRDYSETVSELQAKLSELQQKAEMEKMRAVQEVRNEFEAKVSALQIPKSSSDTIKYEEYHYMKEDLANTRQQLMNVQMHVSNLEKVKEDNLQLLNEKEQELRALRQKLQEENMDKDEFAALKAQLDLYKADYEAELLAKNTFIAKNNQIVEDLQNLQRRNQQLIQEIDRLRGHDFVEVERPQQVSQHKNQCPKCFFEFSSYSALENHVYRCIELDELP